MLATQVVLAPLLVGIVVAAAAPSKAAEIGAVGVRPLLTYITPDLELQRSVQLNRMRSLPNAQTDRMV